MDIARSRKVHRALGGGGATLFLGEAKLDILYVEPDVKRTVLRAVQRQNILLALEPCTHPVNRCGFRRFRPSVRTGRGVERIVSAGADLCGKRLYSTEEIKRAVDGEHVTEAAGYGNLGVGEEDVASMVETKGKLPIDVLLRILRPHALAEMTQRSEIATRGGRLETPIRRRHESRHRSAAGLPHEADAVPVNLRTALDIVNSAHSVPCAEHGHRPADKGSLDANDVMVSGGADPLELLAFALFVRVIHESGETGLDGKHAGAKIDVAVFARIGMSAAHHHGGIRSLELLGVGNEKVCGHEKVRHRLEYDLFDPIPLTLDRFDRTRIERRTLGPFTHGCHHLAVHLLAVAVVIRTACNLRPGQIRLDIHFMKLLRNRGESKHIRCRRKKLLSESITYIRQCGDTHQSGRRNN